MNAHGIFKFSDISASDISFSAPRVNGNGGQTVYINHVSGNPLTIQVPRTRCPFGVSTQDFDGQQKCSVDISFGHETTTKIHEFKKWVESMDNLIKEKAHENSKQWFKKEMKPAVLEEFYKHQVNKPKNDAYPDSMKFKIVNTKEGTPAVDVYNNQKQLIPLDSITKGTDVMIIAQMSSIWFVNKMFGVTWRVKQIKAWPRVTLKSYAFEDESDNDENEVASEEEEEEVEYVDESE